MAAGNQEPLLDDRLLTRKRNFNMLWDASESSAGFQRATGMRSAVLKEFDEDGAQLTRSVCARIETALELPLKWMDETRLTLPLDVIARVRAKAARPGRRADTPELSARRVANVEWLVGTARGAKTEFCNTVGWIAQEFSLLKTRGLSDQKARQLERQLHLPEGWLDTEQDHQAAMPTEFSERLEAVLERVAPSLADVAAGPASSQADAISLTGIASPVTRALIEKLVEVSKKGLVPDAKAVELLSTVVALDR